MNIRHVVFTALMATGLSAVMASPAAAWGCYAIDGSPRNPRDRAYGWSSNHKTQSQASSRALSECRARGGRSCYITQCAANR